MKLKTLYSYFVKQNLSLLFLCLLSAVGIYMLVDVFDRLDNFLSKGAPLSLALKYFFLKIPLIISQIFPLVFFLTLIIQLSIMNRNREIEALESCGITIFNLIYFIGIYCLLFCMFQLAFSQYLGVKARQQVNFIWDNLGKKETHPISYLKDIWFRKGNYIGFIKMVKEKTDAYGIHIYKIKKDFSSIEKVLLAQRGKIGKDEFVLYRVEVIEPDKFSSYFKGKLVLHERDMSSILEIVANQKVSDISLWRLKGIINELKKSGSNVEEMLTVWYGKLAYGFSLFFLSIGAVVIGLKDDNIPVNIAIGLGICFLFYGITVLGNVLGRHSVMPPFLAAWGANIICGTVFLSMLLYRFSRK